MTKILLILIYVLCSGGGLTLLKHGVSKGVEFRIVKGVFDISFNYTLILGMLLYVTSFLLSLVIMSKMEIHYFYPVSAGLIYILVCAMAILFFNETITLTELIGMGFILIGVVIMNLKK